MTEIFFTSKNSVYAALEERLGEITGRQVEICRTSAGKPYLEGNPVFFSLSHSGKRAVYALSDKPVGIDMEIFKKRGHKSVAARFCERERAEITCERDFLKHWTAREAYVKLYGLEIAKMWRRIEFFDGKLFVDGKPADVILRFYELYYGIAAMCKGDIL